MLHLALAFLSIPSPPMAVQDSSPVEAVVVTRDGVAALGEFQIDRTAKTVRRRKGKRMVQFANLDDVLAIEQVDGPILHAAIEDDLILALHALVDHGLAEGYAELAYDSMKGRDPDLSQRLLERARELGSEDKRLKRVETKIKSDRKSKRKPSVEVVDELVARERELTAGAAEGFWERATSLRERTPPELWLSMVEAQLELRPDHAQAEDEVRRLVASGLYGGTEAGLAALESLLEPEGGSFDSRAWIECLRFAAEFPVEIVLPPDGERSGILPDERRLGQLTLHWRPDLVCFRTPNLRVMTSLVEPVSVARCLQLGELVARTLVHHFGDGKPAREVSAPLTLYLYGDRAEYRAKSSGPGSTELGGKEWSAGHYSPQQNVQHVYLPKDEEGFARVMGVYAHELTHNWMRMQCPLYTLEEVTRAPLDLPSYWIVEGVAELVEAFEFELGAELGRPETEGVRGLDIVAAATPEQLIPWERLYQLDYEGFSDQSSEANREMSVPSKPGYRRTVSEVSMFYAQAGATAQYLFLADDGKHRPQLYEYLSARYTGRKQGLDIPAAFGCTPQELGSRVRAFALACVGQ